MGYLPIQYHKLLRDLWGHRGLYLGNVSQGYYYTNYLTKGKHARRSGDINCIFRVDACNRGRALSWYGEDLLEERYIRESGSHTSGINVPMMLPRDIVAKAMSNINITGEFSLFRILNIVEPTHRAIYHPQRDLTFVRHSAVTSVLKKNVTGVLTFEDMCLQKAHMQHDLMELTNDIKQRYADKKYNRISVCIKEVYNILRAFTRMSGMDKVAIKDYPLLNFQTENLALATGYSNQLNSVVLSYAYEYARDAGFSDTLPERSPEYNVTELNNTHYGILGALNHEEHNKPFNFHRAITDGCKLILDSLNPGKNTTDLLIRECTTTEVALSNNNNHRKLSSIVSPEITTIKTVLENQGPSNNYQVSRHYLLGKGVTIRSLITGENHTLPGIPITRFNLNSDLANDAILESMLAPINHPDISDYTILQHCICSYDSCLTPAWTITHGNSLGIILRGILLLELLRISISENRLAKWLRVRDNTIMPSYPYSLDFSAIPNDLTIPHDETEFGKLNLQSALFGLCLSDKFIAGKYPPDLCLLYIHISVRLIRRLLAFAFRTLRDHKDEYASDTDMQASIWRVLHNILAHISNYSLSVSSCGDDKSINLPLHSKYTIHSMLPTHIEDIVTRAYVFQSHLSLMGSLACSLRTHLRPVSAGSDMPSSESLYSKTSTGLISSSALTNRYTWHTTGSILDDYMGSL